MKFDDADIFYEGPAEKAVPAQGIRISSERSQKNTVSADEDIMVFSSLNQANKSFPILIGYNGVPSSERRKVRKLWTKA